MDNKHKNALIGGLLAIVFIMAVGFAGFTQRLTIEDTTSVSSDWNIGFETVSPSAICPAEGTATTACGSVVAPEGSTYSLDDATKTYSVNNAKTLTFDTKLLSPSDTVTYTIVVKNYGDVDAKIAADGIVMTPSNESSVTKYSQSGLTEETTTVAAGQTVTFTVTVTFEQVTGNIDPTKKTNSLSMYINWQQA